MKVSAKDLRDQKYCVSGSKAFAKRHNLDWKKFVKEGIEEEELLATGDAMAIKFVEVANNGRK